VDEGLDFLIFVQDLLVQPFGLFVGLLSTSYRIIRLPTELSQSILDPVHELICVVGLQCLGLNSVRNKIISSGFEIES